MSNFNPEKLAKYTTDTQAPYRCNVVEGQCGHGFENPAGIIMHCNRSHGKTDPNGAGRKRPRKVRCAICGEKFSRGAGITKHMRAAHPDETPSLSKTRTLTLTPKRNGAANGAHSARDAVMATSPFAQMVLNGKRMVVYCPCCGTNIPLVQQAVDIAASIN